MNWLRGGQPLCKGIREDQDFLEVLISDKSVRVIIHCVNGFRMWTKGGLGGQELLDIYSTCTLHDFIVVQTPNFI